MKPWWLAAVLVTACDRHPPVTACSDDLHGVWITPTGARWMLLDLGGTLEGYPLFDDRIGDGAPRVIDLRRTTLVAPEGKREAGPLHLGGDVKRRFMRRADTCDARAPVRITACRANTVQLVLADPAEPLAYAPCAWPQPQPARVETWRRE